ncbi:hypothetical protein M0802_011874 [Mischocyttarus mexicanus]|nr:hypothetical protein M0802_011874 [Mischocyttarus mexicanus]
MTTRSNTFFLLEKCATFLLLVIIVPTYAEQACDRSKCSGPIKYYESLGCSPVYEKENDCCAIRYNCDQLKSRSSNKCYVNGHEYAIGENLRDEDANPCDIGCFCRDGYDGVASFTCAIVDCFFGPAEPNCYLKHTPDKCCPGPKVCLDDIKQRPTCDVNGTIYLDGEYFKDESNPDNTCYCQPDYKGENVEPFCKKPNRNYCSPDFRNPRYVHDNCAPVYYVDQTPQKSCNFATRCQNSNDTVIHNHDEGKHTGPNDDENMMCKFGNLTMHLGDELSQSTEDFSSCMKCLCEVPPLPTCQYLPEKSCPYLGNI